MVLVGPKLVGDDAPGVTGDCNTVDVIPRHATCAYPALPVGDEKGTCGESLLAPCAAMRLAEVCKLVTPQVALACEVSITDRAERVLRATMQLKAVRSADLQLRQ